MRRIIFLLLLTVSPSLASAESLIESITMSPTNPEPLAPFNLKLVGILPDRCWSQGEVGETSFTLLDSFGEAPCPDGLFCFQVQFVQAGLPQGHHSVTITEVHLGTRDPGSWPHVFEFTVGDLLTGPDGPAWGAVKALYR